MIGQAVAEAVRRPVRAPARSSPRADPRGDIGWAGLADAYLQAVDDGLLEVRASPRVTDRHDWSQPISELSGHRAAGERNR
jgi:hypothetical protein